jgi:hypothetical protein
MATMSADEYEEQRKNQEAKWRRWNVEMGYVVIATMLSFVVAEAVMLSIWRSQDRTQERFAHRPPPNFKAK